MRLNYLVWRMGNGAVTSDGGPDLHYNGATRLIVDEFDINARRILKSKLSDPDRFAAAHLALTDITRTQSGSSWHSGAGKFVFNRLNYSRDANNAIQFEFVENSHLNKWWFETVGEHIGMPVIDEDTNELIWPDSASIAR